jgi:hypothetical protein
MHVRWYGQSAFLLSEGERRVMFVDELDEEVDVVWLDESEFDATALPAGAAATSLVIPRAPLDD